MQEFFRSLLRIEPRFLLIAKFASTFPISHRISGAFLATIVLFFYLLCMKLGSIDLFWSVFCKLQGALMGRALSLLFLKLGCSGGLALAFVFVFKAFLTADSGPFLIRVSPLRWQQVFGTGSAILAAFLALAGAAGSLDLPDVLCFNLFVAIYWFFIYLSIYIEIRWGVRTKEKTWLFPKMKAAFSLVKEKPSQVFFLNIIVLIFFYGLIFLSYRILDVEKQAFVKTLLIMGECSAICFCFCSKDELSRFQAVFSFFLSYFFNILLLEKLAEHVFFSLFFLLLIVEFFIVKYFRFLPLNCFFFLILVAYFFSCQEILLWGFALVVLLVFLYLLLFFFQKEEQPSSTPTLLFSLLFLLVPLFVYVHFYYRDPGFHLQILFLGAGALVIYLCFLSTTGWEQVITSLFYILINVIIGGILSDSTAVFFRISLLYFTLNLFIFVFLWVSSLKTGDSLKHIFDKVKVRIVLSKLVFLLYILYSIHFDSRNNWIWPWLATFASQIVALNLFLFFFEKKEDELFQTLGRKQTTFLSRLVIYGGAVFFFLILSFRNLENGNV